LIYSGLRVITVSDSPIDSDLSAGDQKSLLGFFSVNLRKALGAAGDADSADNAHVVREAVEFFAFGVSKKGPVNTAVCIDLCCFGELSRVLASVGFLLVEWDSNH
jgi:hypothetical protein